MCSPSGPLCLFCVSRALRSFCVLLLAAFSLLGSVASNKQWTDILHPHLPYRVDDDFEHNIWNLLLNLLFLEQVSCIFASKLFDVDLARIAMSCHFALYYVTRRMCLVLHDDSSGTIVPGVSLSFVAPLPPW